MGRSKEIFQQVRSWFFDDDEELLEQQQMEQAEPHILRLKVAKSVIQMVATKELKAVSFLKEIPQEEYDIVELYCDDDWIRCFFHQVEVRGEENIVRMGRILDFK